METILTASPGHLFILSFNHGEYADLVSCFTHLWTNWNARLTCATELHVPFSRWSFELPKGELLLPPKPTQSCINCSIICMLSCYCVLFNSSDTFCFEDNSFDLMQAHAPHGAPTAGERASVIRASDDIVSPVFLRNVTTTISICPHYHKSLL